MEIMKKNAVSLLEEAIAHNGIKKQFIAQKLGITSTYLSMILNEKRPLSIKIAVKASKALDLPIGYFFK